MASAVQEGIDQKGKRIQMEFLVAQRGNYRYPVLEDSIDPIGHQSRKSVRGLFPRIAHNARGRVLSIVRTPS
ncbi:hypothetical protein CEXT_783201 [Caerostris extrusa]|uniref:Uncharacterized protein n=1 Tax=Caerostris extrusa TaxID=172846 RepID=A0AAV4XW88_CAEEX|nr:hypothetical protein CEXT_783201 [Caerostris extrusa]